MEPVIEKIKKLMALQESAQKVGSLEEAANAAEKIQTLLLKHNLEMFDIHSSKNKSHIKRDDLKGVYNKKNEGEWIFILYSEIARNNFCDVILQGYFDGKDKKKYVILLGDKDNSEVVRFMALQAENAIRHLETLCWKKLTGQHGDKRNAFRRAYFMGAARGIGAQLRVAKEKAMKSSENVFAMVKVNSDALEKAKEIEFPNLRSGKMRKNLSSDIGGMEGFKDGYGLSLKQGIGSTNGKAIT